MNDNTKAIMIQKLGTLMFANAELAAENLALVNTIAQRDARIAELNGQLEVAKAGLEPQASGDPLYGASGDPRMSDSELLARVGGAAGIPWGAGGAGGNGADHSE